MSTWAGDVGLWTVDCGVSVFHKFGKKGSVMLQTVPRAYFIERDMKYRSGWEVHLASATDRFEHWSRRLSRWWLFDVMRSSWASCGVEECLELRTLGKVIRPDCESVIDSTWNTTPPSRKYFLIQYLILHVWYRYNFLISQKNDLRDLPRAAFHLWQLAAQATKTLVQSQSPHPRYLNPAPLPLFLLLVVEKQTIFWSTMICVERAGEPLLSQNH